MVHHPRRPGLLVSREGGEWTAGGEHTVPIGSPSPLFFFKNLVTDVWK